MDLGISGKIALVVGASRSIGKAVCAVLMNEGAQVVGIGRTSGDEAREAGMRCNDYLAFDLMDADRLGALPAFIKSNIGTPDIIYHAIGGSMEIKDWSLPWSEWEKVQRFNLGICHEINRAFIPSMIEKRWGRIVHTSSDAIKCHSGSPPYTSAKHAVEGYVRTVSKLHSKHNVIISAIRPGNILTPHRWSGQVTGDEREHYFDEHAPIRRFGTAEEAAKVVAFLCSDSASYMAGAIVECDGGSR